MKKLKISSGGILFFLFAMLLAGGMNSTYSQKQMKNTDPETMNSYLVKFPHTSETCLANLDKVSSDAPELLNKIEWGCMSGDHTGYMIVEGKSEVAVLQTVPASLRSEAKVEKLDKFTMAEIKSFHQQKH
jgi:hypothetical protein